MCNPANAGASTLACFKQQDKATTADPTLVCSTCVTTNGCFLPASQGGTCELTMGNATLFSGTLADGKTCSQVFSSLPSTSETNICLAVLDMVFTSKCASSLQETPCLCGATPTAMCLGGTATPTGPGYDDYVCDFNTNSVGTIQQIGTDFTVPTFGAGQANGLVQCAAAYGCDCF
jgi:hypothetical protein